MLLPLVPDRPGLAVRGTIPSWHGHERRSIRSVVMLRASGKKKNPAVLAYDEANKSTVTATAGNARSRGWIDGDPTAAIECQTGGLLQALARLGQREPGHRRRGSGVSPASPAAHPRREAALRRRYQAAAKARSGFARALPFHSLRQLLRVDGRQPRLACPSPVVDGATHTSKTTAPLPTREGARADDAALLAVAFASEATHRARRFSRPTRREIPRGIVRLIEADGWRLAAQRG